MNQRILSGFYQTKDTVLLTLKSDAFDGTGNRKFEPRTILKKSYPWSCEWCTRNVKGRAFCRNRIRRNHIPARTSTGVISSISYPNPMMRFLEDVYPRGLRVDHPHDHGCDFFNKLPQPQDTISTEKSILWHWVPPPKERIRFRGGVAKGFCPFAFWP